MSHHSKEPWVRDTVHTHRIFDSEGRPIAGAFGGGHERPSTKEENDANNDRIVACVNICKGLSTEILENSPDLATAFMSAENARLIQKIIALTNSLNEILCRFKSCISGGNGEIDGDAEAIKAAEKALESAVSK